MSTSTRRETESGCDQNNVQPLIFEATQSLISGDISTEEHFCTVLSLIGVENTHKIYTSLIQPLEDINPVLHKNLSETYSSYFTQENVMKDDEESDLEKAIKLSLEESCGQTGGSDIYEPDHFDNLPSHYMLTQSSCTENDIQANSWSSVVKKSQETKTCDIIQMQGLNSPPLDRDISVGLAASCISHFKQSDCQREPLNSEAGDNILTKKKRNKKKKKGTTVERPLLSKPVLYWMRRDLRIYDNEALLDISHRNAPVIPMFIWSEDEEGPLAAGGATKVWFHYALEAFNKLLWKKYNTCIIFRKTNSCLSEIRSLIKETGAGSIVWNNLYEPFIKQRDDLIDSALTKQGIEVKRYHSYCLYEPGSVSILGRGWHGIGSVHHFMCCCRHSDTETIGQPVDPPGILATGDIKPSNPGLEKLGLARMPKRKDGSTIDWCAHMRESWDFSEDGAYHALQTFLEEGIHRYDKESSRGDMLNTSRISPYLHAGQISPRQILWEAKGFKQKSKKFLRKLAWRDMSYWLLTIWPDMDSVPIRPHYREQRWSHNKAHLKAWQRGYTGYPLVDAAMRHLWAEGWINNYMRHVVASFLISYLHLHWVEGYNWFQDTLMDADVAINAMMWQNGGMSGPDHWNFVMHPVDSAMTCDPKGDYVRKWIPVLKDVPDEFIHSPWKCPPSMMRRARVQLGLNYPERIIVDLEAAREQSLQDVVAVRKAYKHQYIDSSGRDLIPVPGGKLVPCITRMEFRYKDFHPDAKDNPHTAVLKGYRSRKRDELVARLQRVDFTASTMAEYNTRQDRLGNEYYSSLE